ncbi:MAG: hypothetical protein KF898_04435 [Parachlamydiales bacterium]|nr:hypothetical protein [Candidatus Acheromyda pituitae]
MRKSNLLLLSFCALSSLSAAETSPSSVQPQEPQGVTTQPKYVVTPPVAPVVSHGADFLITADFIWWKRTMNNYQYVANGTHPTVNTTTSVKKGHLKSAPFDFEPGFKVGAGLHFAHDGWDLYAQYTWLRGEEKENAMRFDAAKGLFSAFYLLNNGGAFSYRIPTKASAEFEQHFNVLDLELGRNFFISRYLTLRPHFGLKSAWLKDDLDLDYIFGPTSVLPNVNKWDLDLDQKMWSIGLRAGLDTVWHFTKHWGLYGNLSISPLWTSFDSRAKQIETVRANTASPFLNVTTQNTSAKNQQIVTVIEMSLGLTYMTWFYKDRYQLTLQAGWEEQVWMDYNLLINTVEYRAGNMNIQGLTVKAGFEF